MINTDLIPERCFQLGQKIRTVDNEFGIIFGYERGDGNKFYTGRDFWTYHVKLDKSPQKSFIFGETDLMELETQDDLSLDSK